jgi:antitoxin ParD1/3/4
MINPMAHLLPERLKAAAEERAAAGGYGSVDSYIASLIEADEIAPITDDMEAELIKGMDSGPAVDITPEFLADLKRRARAGRESAA